MTAAHSQNPLLRNRLGALLRDMTLGLHQQMYFWGRDVIHPSGNLLIARGMLKSASLGLQGTSCYSIDWMGGKIDLHGACAGWYPETSPGMVYVRPLGRCFRWHGEQAPIPGEWPISKLESPDPQALYQLGRPFLQWWLDYECWISRHHPPSYREDCFRQLKRVPKSRVWLPPDAAVRWISRFLSSPADLTRARRFAG